MTEEKKRLTATELRSQQEERERLEMEARAKKAQEEEAASNAREQAALRAQTEKIKANWYNGVLDASKRPDIRFLVLAEVIGMGGRPNPAVEEICVAIREAEYIAEIVDIQAALPRDAHRGQMVGATRLGRDTEGEVSAGKNRGWRPANLPRFGSNGGVMWLIVRW